MEIKKWALGWNEVKPLEEMFIDVTCKIKRLPHMENVEWKAAHTDESDDHIKLKYDSQEGREVFKSYVKNIKNLECAGRIIKQPDDLWSDNMPPDDGAHIFMIACIDKWWKMNFVSEEERKNCSEPSTSTGSKAANEETETPI